ncbi:MAG: metalloregulator ArsR/SmtB family transcription factor [Pseudomonadota bacterium]
MGGVILTPLSFFKCLADDTRLKTMLLIALRRELCVCDLQDALDVSQPKMSRHLAELRKCKLLDGDRRGQWVYYRLHATLPAWAKDVLAKTLEQNTVYLESSLARLKATNSRVCGS